MYVHIWMDGQIRGEKGDGTDSEDTLADQDNSYEAALPAVTSWAHTAMQCGYGHVRDDATGKCVPAVWFPADVGCYQPTIIHREYITRYAIRYVALVVSDKMAESADEHQIPLPRRQ